MDDDDLCEYCDDLIEDHCEICGDCDCIDGICEDDD